MFQSKRQKSSFICRGLLARIFILEAILHLKWSHIPLPWVVASLHWNFGTGHETYIFFFQYLWWFHAKFRCFGILDCLSLLLISTVYSSAFSLVINCWTGLALLFLLLTVELTCSTFFVINCWIDLALPFFILNVELTWVAAFHLQIMLEWLWIPRVIWKVWIVHYNSPALGLLCLEWHDKLSNLSCRFRYHWTYRQGVC